MNSRCVIKTLKPNFIKTFSSFSNSSIFVLNNVVQMSRLLSISGREGDLRLGTALHAYIIKNPTFWNSQCHRNSLVTFNSLLSMYVKCGALHIAVKLFDEMSVKDTVSWNTMISGFLKNGEFHLGFGYFKKLFGLGSYLVDQATLTTILSACDGYEFLAVIKMVHGLVILNGYETETTVGNALITAYMKCRCFDAGRRVFSELVDRNVITWTAMISGLAQSELYDESLEFFKRMHFGSVALPNCLTYLSALLACSGLKALKEGCQIHGVVWKLGMQSDMYVESALMDMYSKCGCVDDAWRIFESADAIDEVSLTVILVGFAQNGFEEEAIQIFGKMVRAGIEIDPNVVSAILGGFTSSGLGKQVHSLVIKKGFVCNTFVSNGLINMYSKCGALEDSIKVFDGMYNKNEVSWNSMIAAFARHGDSFRVLQLYEEMTSQGVEPTDATFVSLLHACSHVGLVDKGLEFLDSMEKVYGLRPRMEHYASAVDLLGRAGLLNEAKAFIKGLPLKPDMLIWQSLLGACSIYGDTDIGKYAADQLSLAAPDSPVPYILMANIYSSRGLWKERARTIKNMKERGVAKEIGISWIEIEKKVHSFVVADQMHPQVETIYISLLQLYRHMTCVTDTEEIGSGLLVSVDSQHTFIA